MALLQWSDDLAVNIEFIDSQHRELMNGVNHLHSMATQSPPDQGRISDALFQLLEHAMNHFIAEEEMFQRLEFPELPEYKSHNDAFNLKAQSIIQELGDNPTLCSDTLEYLKNWLTEHILAKDKSYAKFLNRNGIN
ncbi:MAG: bacteriohemerythrin [Gammaproteobacteria bacterium]|nr:bacteriohemerythrin [Gammaproteobacteria bacterium]MDH5803277.1 bacteriohemerythrin [Gammaproteobacteria bacterium]